MVVLQKYVPLIASFYITTKDFVMTINMWDERYAGGEYYFGTKPNAFMLSQHHLLKPGMSCLAVADGEGRNGVWLVEQGLKVLSVDSSAVAASKADTLAEQRGVKLDFEVADLLNWTWAENRYDVVVAIFIQFATPAQRAQLFAGMKKCLNPGGLLLLQGYTPRQLEYGTGGPPVAENMYTEALLRKEFADMDILHLAEHDSEINEGSGHHGMSALIDLVARKK
jgi:cyclopropane fatty-acyl-phospholipid synthase-like methyltransferase